MTRIKTVRKKGKMKPKEKGKPLPYKKLDKSQAKDLKTIRGIYSGWKKAQKYILRVQTSPHIRLYLGLNSELTFDRKQAMLFARGYDNPVIKCEYWGRETGLKLKEENI